MNVCYNCGKPQEDFVEVADCCHSLTSYGRVLDLQRMEEIDNWTAGVCPACRHPHEFDGETTCYECGWKGDF